MAPRPAPKKLRSAATTPHRRGKAKSARLRLRRASEGARAPKCAPDRAARLPPSLWHASEPPELHAPSGVIRPARNMPISARIGPIGVQRASQTDYCTNSAAAPEQSRRLRGGGAGSCVDAVEFLMVGGCFCCGAVPFSSSFCVKFFSFPRPPARSMAAWAVSPRV